MPKNYSLEDVFVYYIGVGIKQAPQNQHLSTQTFILNLHSHINL